MLVPNRFMYFFFEPLEFDLFYHRLQPEYNFPSVEDAQRIYGEWLNEYLARADRFYTAQFDLHFRQVVNDFRDEFDLPEYSNPAEFGLAAEWDYTRRVNGLDAHRREYQDFIERSSSMSGCFSQGDDSGEKMKLVGDVLRRPVPLRAANALWFNTTINNPQSVVDELSRLTDAQYIQSTHWARVRAAMLLIHRAICQAQPHFIVGESWYGGGWETDLHVHHLNYEHLGNERYEDLMLLCEEHYYAWHENMMTTGNPGMTIMDDAFL